MSISSHYEITRVDSRKDKLKFNFRSLGQKELLKAIEFERLPMWLAGKPVYNIGFGDNEQIGIMDTTVSNNGDVYKVFNTVLSTIPLFLSIIRARLFMSEAAIVVRVILTGVS